jgi:hypothetical protein
VPIASRPAVAVTVAAVLVAGTAFGGYLLSRSGVDLHLGSTRPVGGHYVLHLSGWVLPAAFVGAVGVHSGQWWAAALSWRRLLVLSWAGAVAWAVTLAMVDGGPRALGAPLTSRHEYLAEVARADSMGLGAFLRDFDRYIVDGAPVWTTHVAGHPPLATLLFVLLHRIGLGGPTPAALLCVAVGACAVPAVLDTVRRRGSEAAARGAAPYMVLAPTALWVATSADALFAGVAALGLWLLVTARGPVRAVAGGAVLGATLFLSYGLVLLAPLALVAAWRGGVRSTVRVLAPALAGTALVVAGFAAAGFVWWEGLAATARRVVLGAGHSDRPGWFFLFGNVAALAVAVGPATVGAFACWRWTERWLCFPGAALLAMTVATVSQLSVGEVERIYLPFAVWLLPLAAALPSGRRWLAGAAGWAFLIALTTRLAW